MNFGINGRPPKFRKAEDMQTLVNEYFIYIKGEKGSKWVTNSDEEGNPKDVEVEYWIREPEPPTITGLCLFLGFESRQSFYDMEKKKGFSYTVKRARTMIENSYELSLIYAKNPNGSIFALKNLGWSDKQEIDHTTKGDKIANEFKVEIVKPIDE